MLSICIPICDIRQHNKQDLEDLLASIEPDQKKYSAVVCCYDSCDEDFIDYFKIKFPFTHTLWHKGNRLNFSQNSNVGLRWARKNVGGHIALVNQDCELPSYESMIKICGEGLATPQSIDCYELNDYDHSGMYFLEDQQPKEVTRTRLIDSHFAFYCPVFSEKCIDKIGYIDEDLKVVFSDDSYCAKVLLEGSLPIETTNIKVYHKGTHIKNDPGWESRSGTYTAPDLGLGLLKYQRKWDLVGTSHANMIPTILKKHTWKEEMRQL